MTNANVLILFFGLLGLMGLVFPKVIQIIYAEIVKFNLRSQNELNNELDSLSSTNLIRLLGIVVLLISTLVYFLE
ncbi:MAG: hypothetical protein GKR92_09165 [Gammaproteobacteria bacterium]|nr:MAG: hypothetical protein GKR92_09165 [Gammaproteobacteria bacterium]